MTEEISQDLAQRMAVLVRDLRASHIKSGADIRQDFAARTAAIAAELPAELPRLDSDLIEARKMAAEADAFIARQILAGEYDDELTVTLCLAGIKRGRALSQGEG